MTAASRGETLRELVTRAVTRELGESATSGSGSHVSLPLVGNAGSGSVEMSNTGIEAIFAAEDAEKVGVH